MVKNIGYSLQVIVATSKNRIFQFEKTGSQLEEMLKPLDSWSTVWSNGFLFCVVGLSKVLRANRRRRERARIEKAPQSKLVERTNRVEQMREITTDQAHRAVPGR